MAQQYKVFVIDFLYFLIQTLSRGISYIQVVMLKHWYLKPEDHNLNHLHEISNFTLIYGLQVIYNYGPYGMALKQNVQNFWW